jgi:hypothetical protein
MARKNRQLTRAELWAMGATPGLIRRAGKGYGGMGQLDHAQYHRWPGSWRPRGNAALPRELGPGDRDWWQRSQPGLGGLGGPGELHK